MGKKNEKESEYSTEVKELLADYKRYLYSEAGTVEEKRKRAQLVGEIQRIHHAVKVGPSNCALEQSLEFKIKEYNKLNEVKT